MKYAEMATIEPGKMFRSASGVLVKTTGVTTLMPSHNIYVHEVQVVEGPGEGMRYLHNLDYATPVAEPQTVG